MDGCVDGWNGMDGWNDGWTDTDGTVGEHIYK